jgi:hypothetical protein
MTLPLHASVCRFVAQMQDCATQCIGGRCFLVPSRSDHRRWRVESNCDTNAAGIDAARDRGYRQNNADVMISATKLASIGNAERTTRALNERVVEHPLPCTRLRAWSLISARTIMAPERMNVATKSHGR